MLGKSQKTGRIYSHQLFLKIWIIINYPTQTLSSLLRITDTLTNISSLFQKSLWFLELFAIIEKETVHNVLCFK